MNEVIENICNALDSLGQVVEDGWNDNRTLNEVFGWNFPVVNRFDLADISKLLANRIREANPEIADEELLKKLEDIPSKIVILNNNVPRFYDGNGNQAVSVYLATLEWISSVIEPEISWTIQSDSKAMPRPIATKLRGLSVKVGEIDADMGKLDSQIKLINDATETAESLPAVLEDLKDARNKIASIESDVHEAIAKINAVVENSDEQLAAATSNKEETDKLVENCEEAYRITTNKGLSAAFDQKARRLSLSMWTWVGGLLASLYAAWHVGSERVTALTDALSNPESQGEFLLVHFFLVIITLGGPLWFAWLSTKQIGQRFRLAEDYGYKASVSKAYEGYRREAARIDEALEARLLESSLSRLEEAPLRLVENKSHGSPWHELVDSKGFRDALKNIPGFREKILNLAKSPVSKDRSDSEAGSA